MKRILAVLILALFVTGCGNKNTEKTYTQKEKNNIASEDVVTNEEITLYYSNEDASFLVPESRSVSPDKSRNAEFILTELLSGSDDEKLVNAVPADTKIISCSVENGLCTVNLSKEFTENNGTASERMAIYSIVNTMCALDGVDKVQFLIEGEKIMIFGSYIFDEPFEADMSIVQE